MKLLLSLMLILMQATTFAQSAKLKVGAGWALIGSGDLDGIMLYVESEKNIYNYISVSPRLALTLANSAQEFGDMHIYYQTSALAADIDFYLRIFRFQTLGMYASFGPSVRYASETYPGMSWIGLNADNEPESGAEYNQISGFHFGATVGLNIAVDKDKMFYGVRASSHVYNQGTGVFFSGFNMGYRL